MEKTFTTRCKENGIIFYSNTSPNAAYDTFYNESGTIRNITHRNYEEKFSLPWRPTIVSMALMFISFLINDLNISMAILMFCGLALFRFDEILDIKVSSKAKYIAATHMVLNAYEKSGYKKIPSLEDSKKESRFYQKCDKQYTVGKFTYWTLVSIAVAFLVHIPALYAIVVISLFTFFAYADKHGWLTFLQVLITTKPTDKELLLVINALEYYEKAENS